MRTFKRTKHKKITKSMKGNYKAYLKSNQWKEKRRTALEFYGNSCGLCGSKHDLQVHHRSYKNIYKETMADLMILCETCHYRYHRNEKEKRESRKSKYMRDPRYDTTPTTYYPDRKVQ